MDLAVVLAGELPWWQVAAVLPRSRLMALVPPWFVDWKWMLQVAALWWSLMDERWEFLEYIDRRSNIFTFLYIYLSRLMSLKILHSSATKIRYHFAYHYGAGRWMQRPAPTAPSTALSWRCIAFDCCKLHGFTFLGLPDLWKPRIIFAARMLISIEARPFVLVGILVLFLHL